MSENKFSLYKRTSNAARVDALDLSEPRGPNLQSTDRPSGLSVMIVTLDQPELIVPLVEQLLDSKVQHGHAGGWSMTSVRKRRYAKTQQLLE